MNLKIDQTGTHHDPQLTSNGRYSEMISRITNRTPFSELNRIENSLQQDMNTLAIAEKRAGHVTGNTFKFTFHLSTPPFINSEQYLKSNIRESEEDAMQLSKIEILIQEKVSS